MAIAKMGIVKCIDDKFPYFWLEKKYQVSITLVFEDPIHVLHIVGNTSNVRKIPHR